MGSIQETREEFDRMEGRGPRGREDMERGKIIIRTSVIGILANLFLALFKTAVGLLSHSIAIVLDAVNNLSDAGSSLVTIVGTRLAARAPDREHPFGHGRIEYLSAMIIAVLVLYAGITSLVESVRKILHPDTPDYALPGLVIVASAVLVKIVLGRYVKGVGERVHSDSLVNSGQDASLDAVISASTLAAALIYMVFHISLEAWLGAVISLVIIKAGYEMLQDTFSKVLGERVDPGLVRAIKETVCSFDQVSGAYDLVLNDYGPDTYNGSIHVEVPDTLQADELDELLRAITKEVYFRHRVILSAIGVYSVNTRDDKVIRMREEVRKIVMDHPYALQMHGFFVNDEKKTIRFDVVVSFDARDRKAVQAEIRDQVQALYPDYRIDVALDTDFTVS